MTFCTAHRTLLNSGLRAILFFTFCLITLAWGSPVHAQHITPAQVKAAYLFNFTKYIDWPEDDHFDKFVIGIYGYDPEMERELSLLAAKEKIKNRPMKVERMKRKFDSKKYQIVYVTEDENQTVRTLASSTLRTGTLLITNECNSSQHVMINFKTEANNQIGFEINRSNMIYEGFQISKDLLLLGGSEIDIAIIYKETEKALEESRATIVSQEKNLVSLLDSISQQQLRIQDQQENILEQQDLLDQQKVSLEEQLNQIERQSSQIALQQSNLEGLTLEIETQRKRLATSQQELESRQRNNFKLQEQIESGKKTLNSLDLAIQESQKQIDLQEQKLTESGETIKKQQNILWFAGLSLLLTVALVIVVYRSYAQKRQSNEILEATNNEMSRTNQELQKTLEELRQTQTKLVQSEKMASLGVLTAGIAHEMNNPITFVSVGASTLQKNIEQFLALIDEKKEKDRDEYYEELRTSIVELIEDIQMGATRTTQIVKGLREFSRMDASEFQDGDINQCLQSALLLLRNRYKENIQILEKIDEKLPSIECFPGQLTQVFVNLIHNAIDAMPEGGDITIEAKKLDQEHVVVKISDTGTGIEENRLSKIFDPFFTTKEVGKGTGLGLSITFGIIQKHNGKIDVNSVEGKGTSFAISLPIQQHHDNSKEV